MTFQEVEFENLKAVMARYGHSQTTLAKLMGVPKNYVCRRFNKRTKWNIDDMRKISEIYEMPMDELFN